MKLSLAVYSTLFTMATAASLPDACQSIGDALGNKPKALLQYFEDHVCEGPNTCDATVDDTAAYLKKNITPQLVQKLAQEVKVSPDQQKQLLTISTQVDDAVEKKCSAQFGNTKICGDDIALLQWGQCAMDAAKPVLQGPNVQQQKGKITQEQCQQVKAKITNQQLWTKTLPQYVDKFGQQCKNGNVKGGQ